MCVFIFLGPRLIFLALRPCAVFSPWGRQQPVSRSLFCIIPYTLTTQNDLSFTAAPKKKLLSESNPYCPGVSLCRLNPNQHFSRRNPLSFGMQPQQILSNFSPLFYNILLASLLGRGSCRQNCLAFLHP